MDSNNSENKIKLVGKLVQEPEHHHTVKEEVFYQFYVAVERRSGAIDTLPVIVSEYILPAGGMELGNRVSIVGEFRSCNKDEDGRRKLILFIFANELTMAEDGAEDEDSVCLKGFIVNKPKRRRTNSDRVLADVLLAVPRRHKKSSYLPLIVWGRVAVAAERYAVGTLVSVHGRVQSREYSKKQEDGSDKRYVAYEVSVSSLKVEESQEGGKKEAGCVAMAQV